MKLFKPMIYLMNRLKFVGKFSLIGGLLAIPIIVMIATFVTDINDNLSSLEKRKTGAEYNQLLKKLLQDTQQHRGLSVGFLSGESSYKEELDKKQEDIAKDIQEISDFAISDKQLFQADDTWKTLVTAWNDIDSSMETLTVSKAKEVQTEFIQSLLDYIMQIGDRTDLILSDSIQGRYLAQNTISTLPNLTERLGQLRAYGVEVLTSEASTEEQNNKLFSLESLIKDSLITLQYEMKLMTNGNETIGQALNPLYEDVQQETTQFLSILNERILQSSSSNIKSDEYYSLATDTINKNFELYDAAVNQQAKIINNQVKKLKFERTLMSLLTLAVFILVIYSFFGFYFSIQNNILNLKNVAITVASGDLTKKASLQTKDELNDIEKALNKMMESLRYLISEIDINAEQVAASSEELTASSEQTTRATEHVASATQEVANGAEKQMNGLNTNLKALEYISTGIERIAENSHDVAQLTAKTSKHAEDGAKSVELNVTQMNNIHASVLESDKINRSLYDRSQEIGKILEVIKGIAEQTNLLALNASIEAARAGEQGKGFAVVAEEVRKLAEQSQQSSIQIYELIRDIQRDAKQSVDVMSKVSQNVDIGLTISKQANEKFMIILHEMNEIAPRIEEVSATAQQMAAETEQALEGVELVADISKENLTSTDEVVASTQEQLASMEEIASAATSLTNMAENLQELINMFKV